jgi:hypothetical protein
MIERPYDVRDNLLVLASRLDEYAARLATLFGSAHVGADTQQLAMVIREAASELSTWRQQTAAALNERDEARDDLASAHRQMHELVQELRHTSRLLELERSMCDQFWKHLTTPVGDDAALDQALEAYQESRDDDYRPA